MIYIAVQGDTWDSVAFKMLGDEFRFGELLPHNRQLKNIVEFEGGEVVTIPDEVIQSLEYIDTGVNYTNTVRVIKAPWG